MNDRAAFLAAIIARPDDDLPRLVYADWLEENGEPEHAALIRYKCWESDIWEAHRLCRSYWDKLKIPDALESSWRRGVVYAIRGPAELIIKHGPVICRQHPIERVDVTNARIIRMSRETDHPFRAMAGTAVASGVSEPDARDALNFGILETVRFYARELT